MLFYNEDWMHFLWTRYRFGIDVNESSLKEYIYSFKGTQVTDFAMNVNGTTSTAESEVLETFSKRFLAKSENGVSVDYSDTFLKTAYELKTEKHIDMYQVWIDALNEVGINPWISIRMNDVHGNCSPADFRKSSYVDANSHLHITRHRTEYEYFDRCFDYEFPEVRNGMLCYISEMLEKYDVCGLELDFTREYILFRNGFEQFGAKIIVDFLKAVRDVLNNIEKKRSHPVKLSLLLPPSPIVCMEYGFDISEITANVKIDCVTILPRWETIDTDMPFELWKRLLPSETLLGGGQQLLYRPYRRTYQETVSTVDMAFGQAIANMSRGADFVYLYNYMDCGNVEGKIPLRTYEKSIRNDANRPLIFNNIGKRETLLKQSRSHVLTYSDAHSAWNAASIRLPIKFSGDSSAYFEKIRIAVGEIPENSKVQLVLGVNSDEELTESDFEIYVNCSKAFYLKNEFIDKHIYDKKCYVFDIRENLFNIMISEIKICKPCMLEYAEIKVIPCDF